jgi:hypothetical protein
MVSSASAQSDTDKCTKAQRRDWSASEKFVWEKLCSEKEADLVNFKKQKEKIGFKFLKDILINDDYSKLLPTRIKIKNAIFNDKIDLVAENINKEINLTDSTFTNIINLSYATFSKSVNFKESEFYQELIFNDAIVKGELSFKDVKFTSKNLAQCRTLLNLQRIQVEGDLKIIRTVFSCSNPNLQKQSDESNPKNPTQVQTEEKESDLNHLIELKAAKIKVSVYLKEISLNINESKNPRKEDVVFQLGVGLVAADIGDAIVIDQTKVQYKQIEIINMSNVKARALISFVNSNIEKLIKDYRIFKLINGDNSQKEISLTNDYLSRLVINLENANINTINIFGNDDKNDDKTGKNSSSNENESVTDKACTVKLGGFIYNQLNVTAYKFLTICINSLYKEAIKPIDDKPDPQENKNENENQNATANSKLIQLLQPMERLSVVSKNQGVYAIEKEMMYRQKKLDYYIALNNLNNSRSTLHKDFNAIKIETGQIFSLLYNLVIYSFQDFISGYGFHRIRIFKLIFPILIINFLFGLFVSYKKQKKIAVESLYFRIREITDENLTQYKNTLSLEEVRKEIDTIQQIIFDTYVPKNEAKSKEGIFYLYLKYNDKNESNSYKKVGLNGEDFKYLIDIVDTRNPNHSKVGFCKNYYPRGNWSVVTSQTPLNVPENIKDIEDIKEYIKGITEIDLYLIDREKFTNWMCFNFQVPFSWLKLKNVENCFLFSIDILIPIIELDKDNLNFIIDAAEDYRLIRIYFRMEKLIGPLLISVLLPLILLTGL